MVYGKGNITKHKGRWLVRLQVDGVRRSAYAASKREAQAILREWQKQALLDGGLPSAAKRTLADLAQAWLESADIRESTRVWYADILQRYVLPTLGKARLDGITPERIEALYRKLTPATAQKVHRVLRRAFSVALRWRWLTANPFDRVSRPRHRPRKPILWTAAQVKAFVAAAQPYPLLVLLVTTGLRLGEALALRWRDVELGGVALQVRESAQQVKGRWVFTEPKTAAGMRTVLLPAPAREALKRLRAANPTANEGDLLFESKRRKGQPLGYTAAHKQLQAACAAAGLPKLRIHDLRHIHASLLLCSRDFASASSSHSKKTPDARTQRLNARITPTGLIARLSPALKRQANGLDVRERAG
ncbi:MAG: site-specific integrase [Thermoflexales bacterium]|nr:site-specific integrase [Thermoflexales bacterium]